MDLPAIGSYLRGRAKTARRGTPPAAPAWREQFEAAYQEHFSFVWRSLVRLGVDPSEAEDAVQEVFVIAYRRWSKFEHRSAVRTWLFGVARRVASHHRRGAQRRERRHQAFGRVATGTVDGEQMVDAQDAASRLRDFLDGLDQDKREVFVLADLEGFSGREVAEALGLKPNTAWSRLRAARAEFSRTFGGSVRKRPGVIVTPEPAPEARARVWALLVPQLPVAKAAAAGGSAAALHSWVLGANLKVFAVTVGSGTVAVGTAAAALPPPPTAQAAVSAPAERAPQRSLQPPIEVATASAVPSTPAPQPPPVQVPATMQEEADEPELQVPIENRRPRRERSKKTDEAKVAQQPPPEEPEEPEEAAEAEPPPKPLPKDPGKPDPTAEELRLLHIARGHLDAGRPVLALLTLKRHKREFPNGSLVHLRKVTRAEALCASNNRRATGIGEAYRLVKKDRDPQLVTRLKRACGLKSFDEREIEAAQRAAEES